jgi:class 3 adenylate cyclase/tetratricopeptide (TPR) repeat protein
MVVCTACGTENDDDARFCKGCAAPLQGAVGQREQRKTVTVVFCDLVGSTRLGESQDPEVVRRMLERYFERMKAIVERHGGTVEKFIGDAVVAVFGVPVAHEDDALRALRAAAEMRAALPELEVEARLGVNTGEIVTSGFGTLVTGDAINVAARLEQAAAPGEVLVGAATLALVADAASVEELVPLELKGKAEPVAAFRLLAIGDAPERAHGSRFVGRADELAHLKVAWARVLESGRGELVTILGEPGVGKSRLITEFTAGLDAPVVVGRCLSYGEGITYFPVVQVIRQIGVLDLSGPLAAVMGESDETTSPEEIAKAFRELLEGAAPLVVVFDDVQWGEETFLDLCADLSSTGAPLLVVSVARPELADRRPDWEVSLRLEPLPPEEVEELIPAAFPGALRERISRAAGGNPLFVTEMVAMAAEVGNEVAVPGTLKALLAARIDQLEGAERAVLECGSVEGEVFHHGPLQVLAGAKVTPELGSLVRKELIRPDTGLLSAEEAFRFCHLLIRDAAYDGLPKASRAEMHERLADWLEEHGNELIERDELVGYHLEQAHRYRTELGQPGSATVRLARRAAARLAAAGHRANRRGDYPAGANLFERALALGVEDPLDRARVQVDLSAALFELRRSGEAEALLAAVRDGATSNEARALADRALVQNAWIRQSTDPTVSSAEVIPLALEAVETFEAIGDELGLAWAERLMGEALWREGKLPESFAAYDRAVLHAQAVGEAGIRLGILMGHVWRLCMGPIHVSEMMPRLEELLTASRDDPMLEAAVRRGLAYALAIAGDFDAAGVHLQASTPVLEHAHQHRTDQLLFQIYEFMGDYAAAEKQLIAYWTSYREAREGGFDARALVATARLTLLYCDQGRFEEAAECLTYGQEVDFSPPPRGKIYGYLRLAARARVAVRRGEIADALELVRTAVELAEHSGLPNFVSWVLIAQAQVERAAGNTSEADAAITKTLALYELKGDVASVARLRDRHDLAAAP